MHSKWLLPAAVIAVAALAVGLAVAAEPGSKDDPLATVSYVEQHAQFVRLDVAAGRSLRLMPGTELVIAEPAYAEITVSEFDPLRDTLVDLTAGAPVQLKALSACHHYVNASNHDVFIRPAEETVVLLRGDWK